MSLSTSGKKVRSALIGFTGFVGGNIARQKKFSDYYNSQNIGDLKDKSYDLIVSTATKAEVWKANQEPKKDWQEIKELLEILKTVKTKHFILISTVNVYFDFDGDEDTSVKVSKLQPYGLHRYKMELFVQKKFPKVTIIRLPQLFGVGIKKNFIYDLIFDNALDFTHKDSSFQFYNLNNLWTDIEIAVKNSISLINLSVEPVKASEVAKYTRHLLFETITDKPALVFNLKTKFGSIYGSKDQYIYHKGQTLNQLKSFILKERQKNHLTKKGEI